MPVIVVRSPATVAPVPFFSTATGAATPFIAMVDVFFRPTGNAILVPASGLAAGLAAGSFAAPFFDLFPLAVDDSFSSSAKYASRFFSARRRASSFLASSAGSMAADGWPSPDTRSPE